MLNSKTEIVKATLKSIWKLGLLYALLAPLMCYLELRYAEGGSAMIAPIIVLPIIFFIATMVSLSVYHYLLAHKPQYITLFHMSNNIVRLLLGLIVALIYMFVIEQDHMILFTLNLLVYYFTALCFTSVHFILTERKKH